MRLLAKPWAFCGGVLLLAVLGGYLVASTPSGSAQAAGVALKGVGLPANDIVYSKLTDRIYASIPSTAGARGNTITSIDPRTGAPGNSVFVGSEPGRLAISDDGHYVYVALDGAPSVLRFDVVAETVDLQFSVGMKDFGNAPLYAGDIAVMPGHPETVAIARRSQVSTGFYGLAIYDNGVQRPNVALGGTMNVIEWSSSPSTIYAFNSDHSEFGFRRVAVDEAGASVIDVTPGLVQSYDVDLTYNGGLLYSTTGHVIDPAGPSVVGQFPATGFVAPDTTVGRTFFLTPDDQAGGEGWAIEAFDQSSFEPLGRIKLALGGSDLIRWGQDGLAFLTPSDPYDPEAVKPNVYLVEASLVNRDPKPTPTRQSTPTPAGPPSPVPAVRYPGDASCSTYIDSVDATLILQYQAALISELPCSENGDANGDGSINAVDSTLVLQYAAGLIRPSSTTLTVDGDDPRCESIVSSCHPSIQSAINAATSGSTVLVEPGTYLENPRIQDKDIILRSSEGPATTTIDGSNAQSTISIWGHTSVTVEGFTIRRAGGSTSTTGVGYGISIFGAADASILRNIITENLVGAIIADLDGPNVRLIIAGNYILHNGQADCCPSGGGINLEADKEASGATLIQNNVIAFNFAYLGGGIALSGCCPRGIPGDFHIAVSNNTIYGNTAEYGGGVAGNIGNLKLSNNIIFGNLERKAPRPSDLALAQASLAAILRNNIIGDGHYAGMNSNQAFDPQFVSPEGGDFRLADESPAIDAGTEEDAPTEDIAGHLRPRDGNGDGAAATDIGAYEFCPSDTC